jgi:uncharacterized heparinase superfamily protein
MQDVLGKLSRGLRKPPGYILRRLAAEARVGAERYWGPRRAGRFDLAALLAATGETDIQALWSRLQSQTYVAATRVVRGEYEHVCPGDYDRIARKAEEALRHRVDLLGSGPVDLGATIDWHRDYKTNLSWPLAYCANIDYCNPERPSDVKFPWEVSRLQWLIPAGQAYLLTGDERFAQAARHVIEQWIQANPYAQGINWACTMEVALRILSWTWFFHVFAGSQAWSEPEFQESFLRSLFLHAIFTERHLERSDVNGNHFTADAAGLVFAGLFFRKGKQAQAWLQQGWQILCAELPRQVHEDGVDFEASVAYHRLVLELFFLPALYRLRGGEDVPAWYRDRLVRMAHFTAAYCRADGSTPLWGDADDARALPLGGQGVNDHRYLLGLLGCTLAPDLVKYFSGPRVEIFWLLGRQAAESLPALSSPEHTPGSQAFPRGGFYIMRGGLDHIFIDCGPVGLAGRGGHGHNDQLSFEAVLNGVPLVVDCGSYVYTADYAERNRFRSTAYHNTPMVAGEEINRFVSPRDLWTLRNDAQPSLLHWETGKDYDVFRGSHSGYRRLAEPVTPVRTITLDKRAHSLTILDELEGQSGATVEIPLHLAPGVTVRREEEGRIALCAQGQEFDLLWEPVGAWQLSTEEGRVSPSYGVAVESKRLIWRKKGRGSPALTISLRRLQKG